MKPSLRLPVASRFPLPKGGRGLYFVNRLKADRPKTNDRPKMYHQGIEKRETKLVAEKENEVTSEPLG